MTQPPPGPDPAPHGRVRTALHDNAVPAGFLGRYRLRRHLPYLPPPCWVATAATRRSTGHAVLYALDELGKNNFLPIVYDRDYDAGELPGLLAPLLAPDVPGPREVRLIGDQPAARDALAPAGFQVDRIQVGMALELAGHRTPSDSGTPPVIDGSAVSDDELARHQSTCFGIRLTAADATRMRQHADWSDRNLFACRDAGGRLVATLRLVTDELPDGTRYGLLRGLAIHPAYRRASLPMLTGLYRAALVRAAEHGVDRCHLLVDKAGHGRRSASPMFEYIGFRPEVLMYRMRQKPATPGLPRARTDRESTSRYAGT